MRTQFRIPLIFSLAISALFFTSCQTSTSSQTDLNYSSVEDLVTSAKASINEITVSDLKEMMDSEDMYVLVDVRTANEFNSGYIPGSVNIPRGYLEFWIDKEGFWDEEGMYVPLKEDKLVLFCRSGNRSSLAAVTLEKMGFTNVLSLQGGWKAWKEVYPELTITQLPETADAPVAPQDTGEDSDAGGC